MYGGGYNGIQKSDIQEGGVDPISKSSFMKCSKCKQWENGCEDDRCKHCNFCNELSTESVSTESGYSLSTGSEGAARVGLHLLQQPSSTETQPSSSEVQLIPNPPEVDTQPTNETSTTDNTTQSSTDTQPTNETSTVEAHDLIEVNGNYCSNMIKSDKNILKDIRIISQFVVYYKDIQLEFRGAIGRGSYGNVFSYLIPSGEYKDYMIAIKFFKNNNDKEIEIVQTLNTIEQIEDCNIIPSRIVEIKEPVSVDNNKANIMILVEGTLKNFQYDSNNPIIEIKTLYKIILNTIKLINCLKNKGYLYTDIKCANILYRCIDNDNIEIYLGDLGSIIKIGNKCSYSIYPYNIKRDNIDQYRNHICDEKYIIYSIGCLFLKLYLNDTGRILYENICN